MRKALDNYLSKHSMQKTVDMLEDNIRNNFNENIVIHHKQVLSFLSGIRKNNINNDKDAAIQFLLSKELSRSYRVKEKFCESGCTEGVKLINEDIDFIYGLMIGIKSYLNMETEEVIPEYIKLHPERFAGEQKRLKEGVKANRKPLEVFQIQNIL